MERDNDGNVVRKPGFTQIVVWEGTIVEDSQLEEFEKFMIENLEVEIQYLETIVTFPDSGEPTTGGRHDVFFALKDEYTLSFCIKRLEYGMRWIEDVLAEGNYRNSIYPPRVFKYMSWNKENSAEVVVEKPVCQLSGVDGNVFNIIGIVSKTLKSAKMSERAEEFIKKATSSGSYDEVLQLCHEYVEVE